MKWPKVYVHKELKKKINNNNNKNCHKSDSFMFLNVEKQLKVKENTFKKKSRMKAVEKASKSLLNFQSTFISSH